jgi:hypothetical protein
MNIVQTAFLFVVTALAEIIGCYVPYRWLRHGKSPWLLLPAALSLAVFSWLLTLHCHLSVAGVSCTIDCSTTSHRARGVFGLQTHSRLACHCAFGVLLTH